jgi:hypothetical protein
VLPFPIGIAIGNGAGIFGRGRSIQNKAGSTYKTVIPNTRWCTWMPPDLMLPGHQGTLRLRISRVLMRMNANETRNAASSRNPTS